MPLRSNFKLLILLILIAFKGFCAMGQGSKIDSLKKELRAVEVDTKKVVIMFKLSELGEDCEQRLRYAQQALQISEKIEWYKGICTSLIKNGDIYRHCFKEYNKSAAFHDRLRKLAIEQNDEKYIRTAYAELARIQSLNGAYFEAIAYFNKIISISNSADVKVSAYSNIAQEYYKMNDYSNAVRTYEQCLKALNDTIVVDPNIPVAYKIMQAGLQVNIADIYVQIGDLDQAINNYEQALKVNEELGMKALACPAEMGLGQCYAIEGKPQKSLEHYERALAAAQNSTIKEEVLNRMAEVYLGKKELDIALEYCLQSKQIAEQNTNKPQLAVTNTTLAKIYSEQGHYAKAIPFLKEAINITQEIGARGDEQNAWEALSFAYSQQGRSSVAFDAYKNFIAIRDSIYNADKAKEVTQLMMRGEFDRERAADSVAQADADKITAAQIQRQRVMIFSSLGGVLLVLLLAFFIYRNYNNAKKSNKIITAANETIKEEKQVSEKLLLNILPEHVADELKDKGSVQAKQFDDVTILFTDFKNFTTVSERLTPEELVAELDACFKAFDEIMKQYGIEKIKTVGDAYLAVCGLPQPNPDHAEKVVQAALEVRNFMLKRKEALGDRSFGIRLGINSGTVVAGIVGVSKFAYDIWGDAVNTAARMEQNSEPGKVNITQDTYELVKDKFAFTYRGELAAKNKGLLKMYFVEAKEV